MDGGASYHNNSHDEGGQPAPGMMGYNQQDYVDGNEMDGRRRP